MAVNRGFRGTIVVDTSHTLDFVGAWEVTADRDITEGKPKITATSTGNKSLAPAGLSIKVSLDGEILAGPNTNRAYLYTQFKAGTTVQMVLTQEDGIAISLTDVIISNHTWGNDSEAIPTLKIEGQAADIAVDDDPDTP